VVYVVDGGDLGVDLAAHLVEADRIGSTTVVPMTSNAGGSLASPSAVVSASVLVVIQATEPSGLLTAMTLRSNRPVAMALAARCWLVRAKRRSPRGRCPRGWLAGRPRCPGVRRGTPRAARGCLPSSTAIPSPAGPGEARHRSTPPATNKSEAGPNAHGCHVHCLLARAAKSVEREPRRLDRPPGASTDSRAMQPPWSRAFVALPTSTSSTSEGSKPWRSSSACRHWAISTWGASGAGIRSSGPCRAAFAHRQ